MEKCQSRGKRSWIIEVLSPRDWHLGDEERGVLLAAGELLNGMAKTAVCIRKIRHNQ